MGTDSLGSEGGEQGDWTQSHVKGQRVASPQGAGSAYKEPGAGAARGVWGEEATLGTEADRTDTARPLRTGLSLPPWGTSALSCQLCTLPTRGEHKQIPNTHSFPQWMGKMLLSSVPAFHKPVDSDSLLYFHAAVMVFDGGNDRRAAIQSSRSWDCLDLILPACCPLLGG